VSTPTLRTILVADQTIVAFLGNHFLQVLGDIFSWYVCSLFNRRSHLNYVSHSVSNPDLRSERRLLAQLAPELPNDIITRLVGAFQDLRQLHDDGTLTYPYSLRGKLTHPFY
jgi:von Willebrand factor A domain-containing protein 8